MIKVALFVGSIWLAYGFWAFRIVIAQGFKKLGTSIKQLEKENDETAN